MVEASGNILTYMYVCSHHQLRDKYSVSITVCGPWSVTFPKMIKYFVKKKNTENNERYGRCDLLISILLYDKVSAFLLWMKVRN